MPGRRSLPTLRPIAVRSLRQRFVRWQTDRACEPAYACSRRRSSTSASAGTSLGGLDLPDGTGPFTLHRGARAYCPANQPTEEHVWQPTGGLAVHELRPRS